MDGGNRGVKLPRFAGRREGIGAGVFDGFYVLNIRIVLLPLADAEVGTTRRAAMGAHERGADGSGADGVAGCSSVELKRSFGFDLGPVDASVG